MTLKELIIVMVILTVSVISATVWIAYHYNKISKGFKINDREW